MIGFSEEATGLSP